MCWISARIRRFAVRTEEGYKEITAHHKQLQQQMSEILLNIALNEKEGVNHNIFLVPECGIIKESKTKSNSKAITT